MPERGVRREHYWQRLSALHDENDRLLKRCEALEGALEDFLDTWVDCDRTLLASDWEEMDVAEHRARAALIDSEKDDA